MNETSNAVQKLWVIKNNGGFYDGFKIVNQIEQAKRYTKYQAKQLNRVIMAGQGTVILASK